MREPRGGAPGGEAPGGREEVAYDEKAFFDSFYTASVRGDPTDANTIGAITDIESRFHYNATENSILRAIARQRPPARGPMIDAHRMLAKRRGCRLLDVGSGTGHWIDFFRDVLYANDVVGVEIADSMAAYLREKYAGAAVQIRQDNIAEDFGPDVIGGPCDWVSAIGVMFHIVDDARWARAVHNLAACLKPGGLMVIGGDFGAVTRNAQHHRSDAFTSWREFEKAQGEDGVVRVNKRVRSLPAWLDVTGAAGLKVLDLVRTDRDPDLLTPENDILLLTTA